MLQKEKIKINNKIQMKEGVNLYGTARKGL